MEVYIGSAACLHQPETQCDKLFIGKGGCQINILVLPLEQQIPYCTADQGKPVMTGNWKLGFQECGQMLDGVHEILIGD